MGIITLTTDFGLQDWFAGTMKGVILGINPKAQLVDITHGINQGDIQAGAFSLAAAFRFFPRGTIHLAVIDPGVGSTRDAIAIKTANYHFVGPDNGVLSHAVHRDGGAKAIHRVGNKAYVLKTISRTFHGRDLFAPAAAHLSNGAPISRLGLPCRQFEQLPQPTPVVEKNQVVGTILYVDRFGNAITNISADLPPLRDPAKAEILIRRRKTPAPLVEFYESVKKGKPLAIFGSTGFLEIAVNGGRAAEELGLRVGDRVRVRVSRARFRR